MPLNDASATAIVASWSGAVDSAFQPEAQQALAALLVRLSAALVPHIADDAQMSAAEREAYLAARTLGFVDDWLARAAAPWRRIFDTDADWHQTNNVRPPIGLRSASHADLVALPVLGEKLARDVARFLARNPAATFDDLTEIAGIGEIGLRKLQDVAYLDRPRPGLVSPSLWLFAKSPSVATLLPVFETSDLAFTYGDRMTVERHLIAGGGGGVAQRLEALLDTVVRLAEAASFAAGGVLASEALAWLVRHKSHDDLLAGARLGNGALLVNEAYVEAVRSAIEGAQISVSLMVFLATATEGVDGGVGPGTLVAALEAAAQTANIRVLLDQDDAGEPYHSAIINKPLVERFKAAGVAVKFDEKAVLLHSKVLVIDSKTVVVGSHNWTRSGLTGIHEISILAEQPDVAGAFQARFDALWNALPDV